MIEILQYEFFQRAIIVLILASVVAALVGSLIVIKKISIVSGSISHGAFGGLGIAYFLGINPLLGALSFSLLGAGIISVVTRKYRNYLDSVLSMFWAGGMSVGILFVFMTPGYASDLFSYLFGSPLLTGANDILFLGLITLLIVATVYLMYESLVITLFDPEFAQLKGIKTDLVYTMFMIMIALAVVLLIKTVGVVLTLAILTISPTIAIRYANNPNSVMLISIVLNVCLSIMGLFISYFMNLPVTPVIILLQIAAFGVAMVLPNLAKR